MKLINISVCCLAFLLFALPTIGNAAQEVFVAEITSASPSSFTGGQSATVTVRIRSTSGSGNVIIEADSWPSSWSVSPKNRNPTINQGTYYDQTFTVTPPTDGGSGTIVWKLYDDDWGTHPNGSTLLATRNQSVSATALKPDLIVQDISISPSSPVAGESVTITATLKNQGNAGASGSILLYYYLDGSKIGEDSLSWGLDAGESDNEDISYTVGSSGNHTVKVVIDPQDAIDESNESNNDRSETYYWNPPPKPDLIVTDIKMNGQTVLPDVQPGQSVRLDFYGKNVGDATSKTSIGMKWWWGESMNAKTHEIDTGLLGIINGLAPGEEEEETDFSWTIPNEPGKELWITAEIDYDNKQNDEKNENNNLRSESFRVYQPKGTINITVLGVSSSDRPNASILYQGDYIEKQRKDDDIGTGPTSNSWSFTDVPYGDDYIVDAYYWDMLVGATGPFSLNSSSVSRTITANPKASLTFRVKYSDLTPASGLTVRLYSWDGYRNHEHERANATTGSDGSVTFQAWPTTRPGEHYIVRVFRGLTKLGEHDDVRLATGGSSYEIIDGPPPITVTSPNGGESWRRGSTHNITWNWAAYAALDVKIEWYRSGSSGTIISSTENDGSHPWPIPTSMAIANDYKVKITLIADSSIYDYSDGSFSIIPEEETIWPPTSIIGPSEVVVNTDNEFTASGASSSLGHSIEYRIDKKGDGSDLTGWRSDGKFNLSWSETRDYNLKAQARCSIHTDKVSSWSGTLKTIQVIPAQPEWSFVQISDTHIGAPGADDRLTAALNCIDFIYSWGDPDEPKPDFIVVTGDIVDRAYNKIRVGMGSGFIYECAPQHYSRFLEAFEPSEGGTRHTVYVVPGNHDRYDNGLVPVSVGLGCYNDCINPQRPQDATDLPSIGPNNYTFRPEGKGFLFIGLDSGESGLFDSFYSRGSGLSEEQYNVLAELSNTEPKIVFLHHPAVDVWGDDQTFEKFRVEFLDWCDSSNVRLVLAGHTHEAHESDRYGNTPSMDRTQFIQTQDLGVSGGLDSTAPYPYGFRIIKVKGDKVYPQAPIFMSTPHNTSSYSLYSDARLHVYDAFGRHVGRKISGEIDRNIPHSFYFSHYVVPTEEGNEIFPEKVIVYDPCDDYCEIVGTETGSYRLEMGSTKDANGVVFEANDIPSLPGAVHDFVVNWQALSQDQNDQNAVTIMVDEDGNGVPEKTITSDGKLTGDEFVSEWPKLNDYVRIHVDEAGYDHQKKRLGVNVTVTNTSGETLGIPLWVVVESISEPNVTLADANGVTSKD